MTIDANLESWIGREEVAEGEITAELVARYRATLGLGGGSPVVGDVAPRLLHWCVAVAVAGMDALGADGHPARGGFLPPIDLPRRMWAGSELEFDGDLRVGDRLRRVSRVVSIEPKQGRSGALCFVSVQHRIEVDGEARVRERHDIVYRAPPAGGAQHDLPVAPAGARQKTVEPSSTLLFRYSALTFNGHRIHYDYPYATGVEGYPGLVVHGPLQGSLMFNFATELRGEPPSRFAFRGVSALCGEDPFAIHADDEGDPLKLWTARTNGPVAMQAEAYWS